MANYEFFWKDVKMEDSEVNDSMLFPNSLWP